MKPYKKITLSTQRNSDISFGKSLDLFFTNCLAGTNNMLRTTTWLHAPFKMTFHQVWKSFDLRYQRKSSNIPAHPHSNLQWIKALCTDYTEVHLLFKVFNNITIYHTSNSLCYKQGSRGSLKRLKKSYFALRTVILRPWKGLKYARSAASGLKRP